MKTKIQKWGNSLAVRIPKPIAKELGIGEGEDMSISLENQRITLKRAAKEYELDKLLGKVSDTNFHGEIEWGDTEGGEVW